MFCVTCFEIVSHPINISPFFAYYESLKNLFINNYSKLGKVSAIWFFSKSLTLKSCFIRNSIVVSMKKCLLKHLFYNLVFSTVSKSFFRILPLPFLSHSDQIFLNIWYSITCKSRSIKYFIKLSIFFNFWDQTMKFPFIFNQINFIKDKSFHKILISSMFLKSIYWFL